MLRRRVAPCRLRLMNAPGPRGNPSLRFLQHRGAQQQSGSPFGQCPATRLLTELGVLPDPRDVGVERLSQPICTLLEPPFIIEEHNVQLRKRLRHGVVVHAAADDRREALVERGGE